MEKTPPPWHGEQQNYGRAWLQGTEDVAPMSHALWATTRPAWPWLALFKTLVFQTSWQHLQWPCSLGISNSSRAGGGEGTDVIHWNLPSHLKTSTPGYTFLGNEGPKVIANRWKCYYHIPSPSYFWGIISRKDPFGTRRVRQHLASTGLDPIFKMLFCSLWIFFFFLHYSQSLHNDVLVNDGLHIWWRSHKISAIY